MNTLTKEFYDVQYRKLGEDNWKEYRGDWRGPGPAEHDAQMRMYQGEADEARIVKRIYEVVSEEYIPLVKKRPIWNVPCAEGC